MSRIALVGGGTAGHITPLVAVAEEIGHEAEVVVIGTVGGREDELVPKAFPIIHRVNKLPFPRRLTGQALTFGFRWLRALLRARRVLAENSVDAVVGFGGYTAAPVYVAAWSLRIPLIIHEANALPGLANRLGARLTDRVGVCFPGTPLPGATVVGMPVRKAIIELDIDRQRSRARTHFGFDPKKPVLLVTGGSTGAARINKTIDQAVSEIVAAGWQVLHLRGPGQAAAAKPPSGVVHVDYTDRMDWALACADFVVSRAGAATVSELGILGLPAVFVPYHVGNGEQQRNARFAVESGGALMVLTDDFTVDWVRDVLVPILSTPNQRATMAAAMASTGRRDAAHKIARWALDAADAHPGGR